MTIDKGSNLLSSMQSYQQLTEDYPTNLFRENEVSRRPAPSFPRPRNPDRRGNQGRDIHGVESDHPRSTSLVQAEVHLSRLFRQNGRESSPNRLRPFGGASSYEQYPNQACEAGAGSLYTLSSDFRSGQDNLAYSHGPDHSEVKTYQRAQNNHPPNETLVGFAEYATAQRTSSQLHNVPNTNRTRAQSRDVFSHNDVATRTGDVRGDVRATYVGHSDVVRASDVLGPSDVMIGDREDDLVNCEYLDCEVLVNILKRRCLQKQPYTYFGESLIVVNPCEDLPIYTDEYHKKYQDLRMRGQEPAHVFSVASQMLRNMATTGQHQCAIVCGDSGAGKTECTKHILKQLVFGKSKTDDACIDRKLEQINPLLELFGNASTKLNENSSRFGKLVELEYDQNASLVTACLQCFILEKFRVTDCSAEEKNFHAFYALFATLSDNQLSDLGLRRPIRSYRILGGGQQTTREEEERYTQFNTLLMDMGLNKHERSQLLKLLAAILLLSNVEFETNSNDVIRIKGNKSLDKAAKVLGLGSHKQQLTDGFLQTDITIRGEAVSRPNKTHEAEERRDAVARGMYSALFDGVVHKINCSLRRSHDSLAPDNNTCIRLLDIAGFENLTGHNGFEQFIINSTSEKLQQVFLSHSIRTELEDYRAEGLPDLFLEFHFPNNQDIVELVFGTPGLISTLEDQQQCQGNDQRWLSACEHHLSASSRLTVSPPSHFVLCHYAGKVRYSAEGFVDKNRDTLPDDLRKVVRQSENMFIRDYFQEKTRGSGKLTVPFTAHYRASLTEMLTKLEDASPVFIRCIKPNNERRAGEFDEGLVEQQLMCSGLLDVIKVRGQGYPVKIRFSHFIQRYRDINRHGDVSLVNSQSEQRVLCEDILSTAHVTNSHVGKTKVFLKMDDLDQLEGALQMMKEQQEHEKQQEEHNRQERERQEKEKQDRERERHEGENRQRPSEGEREHRRDEEDTLSTNTDPFSVVSNGASSESGFASQHSKPSSSDPKPVDPDVIIPVIGEDAAEERREEERKEEERRKKRRRKKQKELQRDQPVYDIFRVSEREIQESGEMEMKVRRVFRLLLYILLFVLVLSGGVQARMSLVWLSSNLYQDTTSSYLSKVDPKVAESWNRFLSGLAPAQLLLCQIIPLIIAWVIAVVRVLFGHKDWPSFGHLVLIVLLDCVGVAGRSVFLFKVLPNTDHLSLLLAVVLGSAACQVPALLKLFSQRLTPPSHPASPSSHSSNQSVTDEDTSVHESDINANYGENSVCVKCWRNAIHYVYFFLLLLAVAVQLGVVAVLYFRESLMKLVFTNPEQLHIPELWYLIIALVCSSLSWWGTFAYGQETSQTTPKEQSKDDTAPQEQTSSVWFVLRTEMSQVRHSSYVISGLAQIGLAVGLFLVFNKQHINAQGLVEQLDIFTGSFRESFDSDAKRSAHWAVYNLMYIQIISSVITPFFSALACRLHMQALAFAAPLCLVTPACLTLSLVCTPESLFKWYDVKGACVRADFTDPRVLFVVGVGVAVWLSMVVINAHVWWPEVERMAKIDRLFTFPHRDPVFLDLGLLSSRRQDRMDNRDRKQHYNHTEGSTSRDYEDRPTVYVCATMWHENRLEMLQALKSIFRIDLDIFSRKKATQKFQLQEKYADLFNPEIHIVFDDAFVAGPRRDINDYVKQFIEVLPEASRSVNKLTRDLKPPKVFVTPYGGRIVWVLPGRTKLFLHLKDKTLIRPRKRWSQILYMYYLLGFRLMSGYNYKTVEEALQDGKRGRHGKADRVRKINCLLNELPADVVRKAENVFIMTLDGDVDFKPESVHLLLDRMKKNKQVAAVCGRLHPIGSGPMVWYQKFEYAVGHWLQKAAEHVFGCVLCCPGCFSLFRGSALIDDNVLRMYTKEPTEAIHHIQYEQGEDRWLCTLLLQQGWKIEYCAGADAMTYAPETFDDFYIQRRRWSPSTLANIIDLIGSWEMTSHMNDNISALFMLYQFMLLMASVLAPGLVVYMIAGSYQAVLELSQWESYLLSVAPVCLYLLVCLKASERVQISMAAMMSAVYAIVMLLVTVGTIINLATADIVSPDVLFLITLTAIFGIAGFVHPRELSCLFHGLLYFITVPSTFLFLTVYFLCNLHIVSWGTREGKTEKKDDTLNGQSGGKKGGEGEGNGKMYKFCQRLGLTAIMQDIKSFMREMTGMRQDFHSQLASGDQSTARNQSHQPDQPDQAPYVIHHQNPAPPRTSASSPEANPHPSDPTYWADHLDIENYKRLEMKPAETTFWTYLIKEYLHPQRANRDQEAKVKADLIRGRNNVVFAFMLLNLMFTLCLLQLKIQIDKLKDSFYIAGKYEPVSTVALAVFSLLLLTQFFGMLVHRWGTLMHLVAFTSITRDQQEMKARDAIAELHKLATRSDVDLVTDTITEVSVEEGLDSVSTTPRPSLANLPAVQEEDGEEEEGEDELAPDYPDDSGEEDDGLLNHLVEHRMTVRHKLFRHHSQSDQAAPNVRFMPNSIRRPHRSPYNTRIRQLYNADYR